MSAVVFGLCALSFTAGCVLTSAMLRREPAPASEPEPVVRAPEPAADERWPPEDYVTRPIHRNPVLGIPTALPAPEPARPALTLVPDQEFEDLSGPEEPTPLDEVRRMHVVRDVPAPVVDEWVDEDERADDQADDQGDRRVDEVDERPARRESNR